jgi:MFS family permease
VEEKRETMPEHTGEEGGIVPAALRHRDFRLFWGGVVLSGVGSQFTTVAIAWQMYELTNSAWQIGLLGLARAVPQIALALLGGLMADAMERRRLMMGTEIAQLMVPVALAGVTLLDAVAPSFLYVASALLALAGTLETPARQALVPNLVPRSVLTSAIALHSAQRGLSEILGPALAGLLLALTGPAWCYMLNAGLCLTLLIALVLIRSTSQVLSGRSGVSLQALRDGMAFLAAQPVIVAFMVLDFGATFFGSSRALLPVYARDILHVGPAGLGMLYAASAVGALLAATAMGMALPPRRAGHWVLVAVAVYGVCTMVFAVSTAFWLALLMLAGAGAGNMVGGVLRNTINQVLTPDHFRGRVAAVNSIFTMGGPQLGQFESGVVAALWSSAASALTGGLGALLVVWGVAVVPKVRHFRLADNVTPCTG